jgi:CRISPR-associated protein Cmr5
MQTSSQQAKDKVIQTRDQEYAIHAYNRVKTVKHMPEAARDRYGSMAHKLPILIRTAGLAQALAFVNARGKDEHKRLLDDLALTLKQQDRENLAETAMKATLSEYIYLTQQALAALLWYKRFAQSVLDVQPGGKGDDNDESR